MFIFPKGLYADVRIEESYNSWLNVLNDDVHGDSSTTETGAIVRVYDGKMWYTCSTNNLDEIQTELDNLATLATLNPDIENDPMVKKLQANKDVALHFSKEGNVKDVTRDEWKELVDYYIEKCIDRSIPEINSWNVFASCGYTKKSFYSSKGAEIVQDVQNCWLGVTYNITVDGVTTNGGKYYSKLYKADLEGHEEEVLKERDRYLDYAQNAVQAEAGTYTCILSPVTTAMFAHESFGHKSEADFMLNDKTLQEEWVMGKKVGSDLVSICDRGDWLNHGYAPYDDEGTKAGTCWLMKNGVLTGRLHDANSAAVLNEELTGNARAESYQYAPIVRMTNTFIENGKDDPQKMIEEIKDGIYIYNVEHGTGQATFTMKPGISYRIRDGKLCEPLRINVLTGSVFETLFDIDAVGSDFELFDSFTCGKGGQGMAVSAGGPSIRVKKLTVN